MKISTKELENKIKKAENTEQLNALLTELPEQNLAVHLQQLCEKNNRTFSQMQVASGVTKSLFYAMLNGTRKAKKEHLLKIGMALGLSLEEMNTLLKVAGLKELYAKNKEDAILIFGLNNGLDIMQIEELLTDARCQLHLIER